MRVSAEGPYFWYSAAIESLGKHPVGFLIECAHARKDREIGEKPRCKTVLGPIDSEHRTKSRNSGSKYASLRPSDQRQDQPSKWLQAVEPERARKARAGINEDRVDLAGIISRRISATIST